MIQTITINVTNQKDADRITKYARKMNSTIQIQTSEFTNIFSNGIPKLTEKEFASVINKAENGSFISHFEALQKLTEWKKI